MAQIADQLDDTELELVDKKVLHQAYSTYRSVVGAEPQTDAEPTPEQITVLYNKIITRGDAPYADLSVLTPYGRRMQKQLKAKGYFLQEDGSWKQVEMPGPPNFQAWTACWRIYRVALLMFEHPAGATGGCGKAVVTPAALEEYFEVIQKLNHDCPECWHLIMQAEDRCRGEHFDRIRRKLARAVLEGRLPMNLEYNVDQPWVGVFTYAARDNEYWNNEVIRTAQCFLIRGGLGKRMPLKDAVDAAVSGVAKPALETSRLQGIPPPPAPPGQGTSRAAKRSSGSTKLQLTQDYHPRKVGRFFVTDREGNQICYKFAKGQPGACSEPCPDGRVHCCQVCLGAHPNVQCNSEQGLDEDPVVVEEQSPAGNGGDLGSRGMHTGSEFKSVLPRKFVFGEFFAGLGGFSNAVEALAEPQVTVAASLDGYGGS